MKKITALLLAFVMCLSLLSACGSTPPSVGDTSPSKPVQPSADPAPEAPLSEPVESEPAESEPGEELPAESGSVEEPSYSFEGPGIWEQVADVPEEYKTDAQQQGTVQSVSYNNGVEDKYFNIYLPYGYEESTERYNVLFVIHGGGGGKPETFIDPAKTTNLQKAIDHMIQNGEIDPFILVAPTWKASDFGADGSHDQSLDMTRNFAENELSQYLIPAVDNNFRTKATRESRAFSGFSMGGVTTWFTFIYDLAAIKYFVPMSGDCWAVEGTGGATKPAETVAALEKAVANQGCTAEDFMIYAFTGAKDYALPNMAPQIYAMQDSELFVFGENTFFGVHESAVHGDPYSRLYLYNVLPYLWKD